MKLIDRKDITDECSREVLDKETHHDHPIIEGKDGRLYWKPNRAAQILKERVDLNDLLPLLMEMGYGKNSEVYRKLYRDIGMSLFGYWEVFYWEVNNEYAAQYVPNPAALPAQ